MRAAVYNRYWHSMGGGERYSGMIAQVLARDGVEVDLLGHSAVDRDELAEHLALDLSGTTMRVIPDKGDAYVAAVSATYDLFVNGTYMSVLAPQAPRSAYVCYFPTPLDHDLAPWRRTAIQKLGPWLAAHRTMLAMGWGTGWYPPEGGRLRQWAWTNGEGIIHLEPGPPRAIQFDLGRPGMTEPAEVLVEDDGGVIATLTARQPFRRHVIEVPNSPEGCQIRFRSGTVVPGPHDSRTLGVAVSRLRLAGTGGRGPRAVLATRFPWLLRELDAQAFLSRYDAVIAISDYTRTWMRRYWQSDADVLHPPIQVTRLQPAPDREKVVLTVGRFFEPGLGHAKRQLEMVQAFRRLHRDPRMDGWSMTVLGGCEESQRPYLETVIAAADGLPVTIVPNAPRSLVEDSMATASVFWSATGLGEDEERAPWAQEHFGMTTAEAMVGGCVPVVIDRAGQREIVRDGEDGFRWSTPRELIEKTLLVAGDPRLRERLSAAAVRRAHDFSDEAFAERWRTVAKLRGLLDLGDAPCR